LKLQKVSGNSGYRKSIFMSSPGRIPAISKIRIKY
jgi:hypothetical protein